jgi:predicted flavoprotein YhiN
MTQVDVLIIGAGAAGLFCAGIAAQQGLNVLLLDHYPKVAEKIRISGGGRSNFTNKDLDPRAPHTHFLGENPMFARSALSRYTAQDFIALMQKHSVPFHEKHKGQMFC